MCSGFGYLLTSDKIWQSRRSVRGRSRQHQFLHGPSKLMEPRFKPGNGHVSAVSPWVHGRDRSTRGFSMARRPVSQIPTSRARRPVGAIAGGWAHSASAATLRRVTALAWLAARAVGVIPMASSHISANLFSTPPGLRFVAGESPPATFGQPRVAGGRRAQRERAGAAVLPSAGVG